MPGCRTLVVDVGKTFMQAALELFPKHNLKKIDAVLITHAHADGASAISPKDFQTDDIPAMNGLDDLRGWTLGAAIQDHIDIYLTRATFEAVERCFPYLVCCRSNYICFTHSYLLG
jgi:glyoxylase-like metal-dependent hydrolase (beta-lactamase superfamily II)